MSDLDVLDAPASNASADEAPPAHRRRRSRKPTAESSAPQAAPSEAPASVPDQHGLVRVRNTCKKTVHSPSGSVKAGEIGTMKLLDANRLRAYVEIVSG